MWNVLDVDKQEMGRSAPLAHLGKRMNRQLRLDSHIRKIPKLEHFGGRLLKRKRTLGEQMA